MFCIFDGCYIQSSYNIECKKAQYCVTHKRNNMIYVKSKKCIFFDCKKCPNFNFENETLGLYCKMHKLETMVNIHSLRCKFVGCKIQPVFNFPNETTCLYCKMHKLPNMINIKSRKCIFPNCNILPSQNYPDCNIRLYCSNHKLPDMIDITSKRCLTLYCCTKANSKYKNYCLRCFIHLFPNEKISKNYKTKEKTVIDLVKIKYPAFTYIEDRQIQDGCSKRRPDLLIDMGTPVIIVEIDENKHDRYECECENKRMMEISQDLEHRPVVFIRFNPDGYIDYNKVKIQTPWTTNKL